MLALRRDPNAGAVLRWLCTAGQESRRESRIGRRQLKLTIDRFPIRVLSASFRRQVCHIVQQVRACRFPWSVAVRPHHPCSSSGSAESTVDGDGTTAACPHALAKLLLSR